MADGSPSPCAGQYLKLYELGERAPVGHVVVTDDPAKALHFESHEQAHACWNQDYGIRPDGKPNKPLTAFTIAVVPLEEAKKDKR